MGSDSFLISAGLPALILAPMEGVVDAPMRALLTEEGGFRFCVSEFLRISQNVPSSPVYRKHVPELARGWRTPAGAPVLLQLLGGDAGRLAEAAALGCELGAPGVDLNFGCPAPTVNRHDGGATLLKYPQRIREIVRAVRAAVPREKPVSAKLRLGWDDPSVVLENAGMAAEGGASWVTLHGRTKVQGYQPPAYWGPIGEVRSRLGIPVVANGEIWTLEDFRRCREETGCEHFMIGRGALADTGLARRISAELGTGKEIGTAGTRLRHEGQGGNDWPRLLRRFSEHCLDHMPQAASSGYALRRAKQWLNMASRARNDARRELLPFFERAKKASKYEEILGAAEEWARKTS